MNFALFLLKNCCQRPLWPTKLPTLLVLMYLCAVIRAQFSTEPNSDDYEIITDSYWNSLQFSINDNEKYELQSVTCKGKGSSETENFDNKCDNLLPCTTYVAILKIKRLQDSSEVITEERNATTEYGEPIVEIISIETGTEELDLAWRATNESCISFFRVELKALGDSKNFQNIFGYNLHINELYPCLEYNITVFAYDIHDELVSQSSQISTTEYAEPGNVNLNVEEYENAQIKVTWEEPKYYTCISYYYLKWFIEGCSDDNDSGNNPETVTSATTTISYDSTVNEIPVSSSVLIENYQNGEVINPDDSGSDEEGICMWFAKLTITSAMPSITQHPIGNLQGCTIYELEMYINSETDLKSEPLKFTAPEQIPGVVKFEAPITTATEMTVLWSPPKVNGNCVKEYKVTLKGPLQRDEKNQQIIIEKTKYPEILFTSLDPCGRYTIQIIAISLNGTEGLPQNSIFETIEAKPSAVRNPEFIAEPQAINISWSSPIFADLCLTGYRLSGWIDESSSSQNFDRRTEEPFARFEKLYACQSYTVQIIPETTNTDGESIQIEVETAAMVAEPSKVQAISKYPNAFEISAADENFDNKCETIIARFFCEETKPSNAIYKTAEQYVETLDRLTFKAVLQPLSPINQYRCYVYLFNTAGWSNGDLMVETTLPYYPDPPEQLTLVSNTNEVLNFSWEPPTYPNGMITLYLYYFQRVRPAYFVPPTCKPKTVEPDSSQTANRQFSPNKLLPYTIYSIQVAAKNAYGVGDYTRPFLVTTQAWISDPIDELHVVPEGPYLSEEEYRANVVVTWLLPCESNGEIELFILDFIGIRAEHKQIFQRRILPNYDEAGKVIYNETDLRPEYTYTVTVAVKTKGIESKSPTAYADFKSPAGIPQKLTDTTVGKIKIDAFAANNPTKSAVVSFPVSILTTESGEILYAALLISEKGCNPSPDLRYGAYKTWPETSTWYEVFQNDECIKQYQATEAHWNPRTSLSPQNNSEIVYTIGSDACSTVPIASCEDVANCSDNDKDYCNGPLKPDTEYHMVLRLFTRSGFNDVILLEFRTDALFKLTLIIVSVCSCLLLALIAGFIYIWVTKRMLWHRESCHGIEDSFGDIVAKNFAIYYREVSKPEKLAREFKELTLVAMDLSYAASELGSSKNRFADIFPYDKNRVILDIDAEGSDYINASFIDGYKRKKEYIATQGPKPESTMDFWRMVLQHNVRVIVMVTQFREGNETKCHEYYPFKSKGINVTLKKKDSYNFYDRSEMLVVHEKHGLRRKVVHFYFKKWPDHGCPTDPSRLIMFVRKVKSERVPSYSPIVVHCSAGVGRTGTFIGLDIIMQRLKYESKINVYETVKKLRFQRMKMVQTLEQYTLLYACVYELVKHKNTHVKVKKTKNSNENPTTQQEISNNSAVGKKVSFQDDPDVELDTVATTILGRSTQNRPYLNSVDEYEEENISPMQQIRFSNVFNNDKLNSGTRSLNTYATHVDMENPERAKQVSEVNNESVL